MCRSNTTETSCASTFATPLLCIHTNRSDTACGEFLIIDFVGERCTEMMSRKPYELVLADAPPQTWKELGKRQNSIGFYAMRSSTLRNML